MSNSTNTWDTNDEFQWDRIVDYFDDAGVQTRKLVIYDDGTWVKSVYENDLVKRELTYDKGNLHAWDLHDVTFTHDGSEIVREYFRMDDGSATIRQHDLDQNYSWTSYDIDFNANGFVIKRDWLFDNGDEIHITYNVEDGTRDTYYRLDGGDIYDWHTIELECFDMGNKYSRNVTWDDGRAVHCSYVTDVLTERVVFDGNNVYNWSTVTEKCDLGGVLYYEEVVYDNGSVKEVFYEESVRTSTMWSDANDAYRWKTKEYLYDATGEALDGKIITMDDGRERHFEYDNGTWLEMA